MKRRTIKKIDKVIIGLVFFVLFLILIFKVVPDILTPKSDYRIIWGETEMEGIVIPQIGYEISKQDLTISWLNNNCEILSSNCTYIKREQGINFSKAYISNTEQTPNCLNVNDCFDLVCIKPILYQCGDYKVEVSK